MKAMLRFLLTIVLLVSVFLCTQILLPPEYNLAVKYLNYEALRLFAEKNYDDAFRYFKYATTLRSDAFRVYVNMAICYLKLDRQNEAAYYLKKAQDLKPFHPEVESLQQEVQKINTDKILNDALNEYSSKNYSKAAVLFSEVLQLDPGKEECYNYLAICYRQIGDTAKSIATLKKLRQINPVNGNALLANTYFRAKNYRLAIPLYKNLVKLTGGDADVFHTLALCYNRLDQQKSALTYIRKAVEIKPDDDNIIYSYASILRDARKYKDALSIYEDLLHRQPAYAYIYINMMEIHQALGNPGKAKESAKKAAEILRVRLKENPQNEKAREALKKANKVLGIP